MTNSTNERRQKLIEALASRYSEVGSMYPEQSLNMLYGMKLTGKIGRALPPFGIFCSIHSQAHDGEVSGTTAYSPQATILRVLNNMVDLRKSERYKYEWDLRKRIKTDAENRVQLLQGVSDRFITNYGILKDAEKISNRSLTEEGFADILEHQIYTSARSYRFSQRRYQPLSYSACYNLAIKDSREKRNLLKKSKSDWKKWERYKEQHLNPENPEKHGRVRRLIYHVLNRAG